MPVIDSQLVFAEAQAATNHLADTASTNVYDTGGSNGQGDQGLSGENLFAVATVDTTATSGGAATVQAVLQDSADNVTFADVVAGPVVAVANAVAGTPLLRVQPPVGMRRYWRVAWRIGTADLTAGKFTAYLVNALQYNVARDSGFVADVA